VCLPNGSEAALTILGIEQAGCRQCLLPVAWSEKELEQALEAAGLQAVVTQSTIGEERPADLFCAIAARTFNLRFLCAYGPDVPDGVIDLDRIILSEAEAREAAPEADGADDDPGLITFGMRAGPGGPLHRTGSSLVAAAVAFLVSAQIEPGDRIISLLAPDDLRGGPPGSPRRSSAARHSSATAFLKVLRSSRRWRTGPRRTSSPRVGSSRPSQNRGFAAGSAQPSSSTRRRSASRPRHS